ncbi:hypothetical protein [Spiroplasma ixodetis]|uniref:Transposase n=1 Tax=Spiroplasma ixodetis TaxID=2141 RepID=A0ABM8BYT5_9MOLU|nr:hypothetical protein [Spiroplasma ixodetis]BDT05052.1 hypothetical protein SHM_26980 [Spiroplasma ixodetis]
MLENENNVQQTTEPLTENNASSQEIENKVNEAENKLNKLNQEIKEKEIINIFKKYQVKTEFYDFLKFKTNNLENSKIEETIKKITDFSPHVLVEGIMKLNEFNNAFQTEQQCLAYIANLKENKCIRCFNFNLNTSDLKRMRCLKCNQTFSILTGTIFSRSQTSLTSWFYLIFRWINTKHGIPSTDIAKELGVTLKTAWRMTHKIRTLMGSVPMLSIIFKFVLKL